MKKPSVVSFLITLLLAAAVCTHGNEFVTDTDGNPVEVGGQYYIQTVKIENYNYRGGLVPAVTLSTTCPFQITETYFPNQPGLPVIFGYPPASMENKVQISDNVTIGFESTSWPGCHEYSKFWKVRDSLDTIVLDGAPEEKNSWFNIEKAGANAGANTYKFTTYNGRPVGIIPLLGRQWIDTLLLAVTKDNSETVLVKFIKVATSATTSTSRVEKLGRSMFY